MRKLLATLIVTILLLSTVGCEGSNPVPTTPTTEPHSVTTETTQPTTEFKTLEHLELKANELPLNSHWLSDDLEKVGLKRTTVSTRAKGFITEQSKIDKDIRMVFILSDHERYGKGLYHDLFLAVQADTKVIYKDLTYNTITGAYSENLYLSDIDGDGIEEIILHQCVGISGGAGQYLARVFKVENDEINEIFCSTIISDDRSIRWDTGFVGKEKPNFQLEITNTFTGYTQLIDLTYDKDSYIRLGNYDDDGNINKHIDISTDTFLTFIPKDIDNDGICEIYCEQYTSHLGHTQHIGHAISILKYNSNIQEFEVIDAWFEPASRFE